MEFDYLLGEGGTLELQGFVVGVPSGEISNFVVELFYVDFVEVLTAVWTILTRLTIRLLFTWTLLNQLLRQSL